MKIRLSIFFLLLSSFTFAQLQMGGWQMHNAYGNVNRVVNGFNKVYALSNGSLMSVDKEDGTIEYYNKLTGLTSSGISKIYFDRDGLQLIIAYNNGYIDFLREDGSVENLNDLYMAQVSVNKTVQDIVIDGRTAYMAMDFGIMEVNITRKEIKETYYIGNDASAVNVLALTICKDTLFALSDTTIYAAPLSVNKIDYHNWTRVALPNKKAVMGMQTANDNLYLLQDSVLYLLQEGQWQVCASDNKYYHIRTSSNGLLAINSEHTHLFNGLNIDQEINYFMASLDVDYDAFTHIYWFAYNTGGVGEFNSTNNKYNQYKPNGPISEVAYRLRVAGRRLYVVQGGHLGVALNRPALAMYYDDEEWTNFATPYFESHLGQTSRDYSDIVGSKDDPSHFFIATYSNGLIEFRNNEFYKHYNSQNSPLYAIIESNPQLYTWVDGISLDRDGNLWMVNQSHELTMRVLLKDGSWYTLNNEVSKDRFYVMQMLIPNHHPNMKLIVVYKDQRGIGVVDDNGTIKYEADDRAKFRTVFTDQNGRTVSPEYMFCAAEDINGEIWVGTSSGIFIIPDLDAFFTSDACRRVIIDRTDDSGLADYLLGEEQINAIAIDGAGRKWIGTQSSGLYLMSADGKETIEHFTVDNSPLPDNTIISLAIEEETGVVYIGTGMGLMSYQSDAAAAHEDYSDLFAYPNPVRPDYEGVITIAGLMADSYVNITDAAGNLVAKTTSLGGVATWDIKDGYGRRVRSGVYFGQCVSSDGAQYALVKILVMN